MLSWLLNFDDSDLFSVEFDVKSRGVTKAAQGNRKANMTDTKTPTHSQEIDLQLLRPCWRMKY